MSSSNPGGDEFVEAVEKFEAGLVSPSMPPAASSLPEPDQVEDPDEEEARSLLEE